MPRNRKDPQSHDEWQAAADAAEGALTCDSARQYGLVSGGPKVNVERCVYILEAAARRGIKPCKNAAERFVAEWNEAHAPQPPACPELVEVAPVDEFFAAERVRKAGRKPMQEFAPEPR